MTSKGRILVIDDVEEVGEFIDTATNPLGLQWRALRDFSKIPQLLTRDVELVLIDPSATGIPDFPVLNLLIKERREIAVVLMSRDEQLLKAADQHARLNGLSIAGNLK